MDKARRISRSVVFVSKRFNGYYRYQDKFQVFPLDVSLRGVANLHIPLCIEFAYDPQDIEYREATPKQVCISDHEHSIVREYRLLLTVLTQYNFFTYNTEQCWFFPLSSNNDISNVKNLKGYSERVRSCWGQKSFSGDLNDDVITTRENEFSHLTLEKIETEGSDAYFNVYGKRLNTEPVTLPMDMDSYFDAYYRSDKPKKAAFLSAASLFKSGLTLRDDRSHLSLSFAAFISSIETLSAHDYQGTKVPTCPECNAARYQVAKKFREFFAYYTKADGKLIQYVKRLYSLRSKILHAGQLFLSDLTADDFGDLLEIEHMIRLVRIALVNWLISSESRTV